MQSLSLGAVKHIRHVSPTQHGHHLQRFIATCLGGPGIAFLVNCVGNVLLKLAIERANGQ
jgi:hypothetical protein